MSSLRFQNDTSALHHLFYESHKNLITSICIATDNVDRIAEFVEQHLGPPQKLKIQRDPKKPLRPKSSYLYFCDVHRGPLMDAMRQKGESIRISKISKILGKQWKAATDEIKKPFVEKANMDKERYSDEMQSYLN